MRISQLAEQAGVPVSTVRYYERIGLLGSPSRSAAGYRDYDDEASTRLRFVARSRQLGLTCDQVAELLPVWAGVDCVSAHARVSRLIDDKQVEISARIAELTAFAAQLDEAKASLEASSAASGVLRRPHVLCAVRRGRVGARGHRRTARAAGHELGEAHERGIFGSPPPGDTLRRMQTLVLALIVVYAVFFVLIHAIVARRKP